jgi:hypothetical protein
MKYARRSVSDQDIRRYEMFSQVLVSCFRFGIQCLLTYLYIRTCNNLADLETTSSFQKAQTLQVDQQGRAPGTLGSQMTRRTMICMPED